MEFATRHLASFALSIQILIVFFMYQSCAYDFYVGGKNGWAPNPSEAYNNWASSHRFQVNDKLVFRYNNGEDSVLVVKKEDYDTCNTSSPIQKMADGNSVFQFDHSGHFFFISGASDQCLKGEKLVVVVIAVRHGKKTSPAPLPPPPSPASASSPSPSPSPLSTISAVPSAASPSPWSAAGPNSEGASVPAPAPVSGEHSSAAASGLSIGRVWFGVIGAVLSGVYFVV